MEKTPDPKAYRQDFNAFLMDHFSGHLTAKEKAWLEGEGGWRTLLASVRH